MSDIERLGLGKIIETPQERDAVHIAVVPMKVFCSENSYGGMQPGTRVGFLPGHSDTVADADSRDYSSNIKPIGIIDPFLDVGVRNGQTVWVYLFPGTVTGLRHHWEHPAFNEAEEAAAKMSDSERWLRTFAEQYNFDYDDMLSKALNPDADEWGAYIVARGVDLHSRPGEHDEFWRQLEAYSGQTFDGAHKDKVGWSCSC